MNSLDFLFNFEHFLPILVQEYGLWIYAILFLIIFSETAFVFMFFLPGDSLLLAVGALCSVVEIMHLGYMITLLFFAAALGYMVNFHIGRHFGDRIFNTESRFIKQEYLQKNQCVFLKAWWENYPSCPLHSFCTLICTASSRFKQYELYTLCSLQYPRCVAVDQCSSYCRLFIWSRDYSSE